MNSALEQCYRLYMNCIRIKYCDVVASVVVFSNILDEIVKYMENDELLGV